MTKAVLLMDDDNASLQVYTFYFESKGYQVLTAHNANIAIEVLQNSKIDLVLLDLVMPGS